jgi:hypothetical protein
MGRGIAFGWVLESSGFSSSRKLAGVFYGYDAVVLKVFFTAAITAMLGLLFMSLFGWIDLDLAYVNPTYLTSALGGGGLSVQSSSDQGQTAKTAVKPAAGKKKKASGGC